jgi:DNA-binding beta-propeller fold protein YncE
MRGTSIALGIAAAVLLAAPGRAEEPLALEAKIPLGNIYGRIDHMAVDVARQRVFVAELGNDSVGVIDLKRRQVLRTLTHLKEPQGVGYVAKTDTLYVASGLDGALRPFAGPELKPGEIIPLGGNADNIRVDAKSGQIFVGYGAGGIAVIDPATNKKQADIALREHPEGFQISADGTRIFVNVPDAREIAVIDAAAAKQVATWPMRDGRANFAMALDGDERVLTVFRRPARLAALSAKDGNLVTGIETCEDADDVFLDAPRKRVYVSCGGDGVVDAFERRGAGYQRLARVPTSPGARTSLFIPELDRLIVAARAVTGETPVPAALWIFRPAP